MNNLKLNKNTIVTSILVIILAMMMGCVMYFAAVEEEISIVNADTVGLNGVVEDGYTSIYAGQSGVVSITNWDDGDGHSLKQWLETAGTSGAPKYAYLSNDIPISSAVMTYKSVQYHYLDGCGHKITIQSAKGNASDIVIESASITASDFKKNINYLDCDTSGKTGDTDGIITTYAGDGSSYDRSKSKTPFGASVHTWFGGGDLGNSSKGFFTAGFLASIFAYSEINNTQFVFDNNDFCYNGSLDRGISVGILFGYMFKAKMDNCSLDINKSVGFKFTSNTASDDGVEGLATNCLGGYAGVIDKNSSIKNSKIAIKEGEFLSAYVVAGNGNEYERVFVGGMVGSIVNGSTIINSTASGGGNLRGWTGTKGHNYLAMTGIISGINVAEGRASAAYTPASMGTTESGSSKVAAGTIDGVISYWTGIAMYRVANNSYIYGDEDSDSFYNGTARTVINHFFGGIICGASEDDNISNVFYAQNATALANQASSRYNVYGPFGTDTAYGIVTVGASYAAPVPDYFDLQLAEDTTTTIASGNPKNGLTLEWSDTTRSAVPTIVIDATKTNGYNAESGAIAWNLRVESNNGATNTELVNKVFPEDVSSIEQAIAKYRRYTYTHDTITRESTGVTNTINASIGKVGTYLLNASGDKSIPLTEKAEYDGNATLSVPSIYLYTYKVEKPSSRTKYYRKNGGSYIQTAIADFELGQEYYIADSDYVSQGIYKTINGVNYLSKLVAMYGNNTYSNASIWKAYKDKKMNTSYSLSQVIDAGIYGIIVYNGITQSPFDFIDSTKKIATYRVDNKYYNALNATSFWQPTFTYTINQVELTPVTEPEKFNNGWEIIDSEVDGWSKSAPSDFVYDGAIHKFKYSGVSGFVGSDSFEIPMTYEIISYKAIGAEYLENNNDYYYLDTNGQYKLFGTCVIDGEDKYLKINKTTTLVFYKATEDEENPYEEVSVSNFEINTTYYVFDGTKYITAGKCLDIKAEYVTMDLQYSGYYRRVYTISNDGVRNAGDYRITINNCKGANYKLSDELQREWFITVTPRTVEFYFRDMNNVVYNAQAQKATWAVAKKDKSDPIKDSDNNKIGTADVSVANIVIYNVLDASAINVTFDDDGKEFKTAGKYFVTISLASGAASNNYYLPGTIDKFTSEEGETIFDEYSADELIAEGVVKLELNNKEEIIGVTRIVTIKQAEVGLLRQYTIDNIADAAFIDSEYGTTYNYYNAITNPVYVLKNITFKGEAQSGYFETDDYKGFNTLPCVIKGVTDLVNPKYFDLIYCDPIYYPAKLVGDTYVVDNDAEGISVISAKGIYVAKLTFDSDAYINYIPKNFYVIYEVIGVNATITIDTSSLEANREYDMQDHTSDYANTELNTIASVSGLVKVDELKGADVNFKYYVLNDETEDANAITVNAHKYEPIATVKDAGSYIMVIAHDSISEASYYVSFENADHSAYTGPTTTAGDPYYAFEITQIQIKVRVTPAEKMYSYAFNSEIHYEVLTGEDDLTPARKAIYDQDKANIIFKFTSEGFAAGAEVGQYDMAAACEGTSAKNYTFEIVNETKPFTVKKYVLTYSIGNIEKEYGEIFDFGYRPINLTEAQFNGYKAATTLYTKEDVVTYPLADAFVEGVLYFLANDGTQSIAITNKDIFGYYKNATQLYVKGVGYNYPEATEYVADAAYSLANDGTQPITINSSALFGYYKAATTLYTRSFPVATEIVEGKNYFLNNDGTGAITIANNTILGYYNDEIVLCTMSYVYTAVTSYDSLAEYYSDQNGTEIEIADADAFDDYEGTLYTREAQYSVASSYTANTQYYARRGEDPDYVYTAVEIADSTEFGYYTTATDVYVEKYTAATSYTAATQYYVQVSENVYEEATKDDAAVFGYYTIATPLYIKSPIDVYNPIESTATFDITADYYLDDEGNDQVILDATTFGYYKESHNIYKKVVTPNYSGATEYASNTQYYIEVLGEKVAVVVANAKEFGYYTNATVIYVKGTTTYEEATAYATNVQYYLNEPVEYTKTNGVIRDGDTIDSLVFEVTKTVNEVLYNGTAKNAPTGAYEIVVTPTGTRASNYSIEIVGRFTVIKKTITLDTITANANLVYDATEKAPTVTFNGVYGEDEVIAEITYNSDASIKPINAGEYTIKVTGITGAQKDNYIFNPTADEQDADPFTITKREVTVDVDDFTMGYGDTKLVPSVGKGYELVGTSDDFVYDSNDEPVDIIIGFETLDPELMNMTPGQSEEDCVSLIISGDAVDNYILTINSYGKLTVNTKALVEIELKESSMEYTGENLKDSIELDTNGTGVAITEYYALDDDYTGDDAVEYNAHKYKPTEEIINHGEYLVKIEVTSGTYYSGDVVYKTFAVDKATWLVEDFEESDITVNYNSITFGGKFAQYKDFIRVSLDGTFTDFENDVITGLKANTRYEFYVKILELDNYNESAVMRLSATTTYDPNQINSALDTLGTEFGYGKIVDYKKILQDYNKVADVDKALVNATKFSAATARYDKLMSAGSKAVTITKQIAGRAANKTYQVAAAASVGGAGIVLAGLSCLFINKKKKQNKVKEEK